MSSLLKPKVSVAGEDPFIGLGLVQVLRAVKFAKLLEDGRRLENLSWRLTFRGLEPPGAGYHDSDPKRNRVKTLAPEFDDGVLLHITMAPGNVGEGMGITRPLVDIEILDSPGSGGRRFSLPPPALSEGGMSPSEGEPSRMPRGEFISAARKTWSSGHQLGETTSVGRRENDDRDMGSCEVSATHASDASTSGLSRGSINCTTCRRRKLRCDRTQPTCDQCSTEGLKCFYRYRPPPPQHTGFAVGTLQYPYQSPATGSQHEGHSPELDGGTLDSSRGRRQARAHPRARGSRSCSPPEGHQSADEGWESKKKVDWYDAQLRAGVAGLPDTDSVAAGGSGRGSLVAEESRTRSSSLVRPPGQGPSAWQLHLSGFLRRAQAGTPRMLNTAQVAKEASLEYATLSVAEKEKYERMSQTAQEPRVQELAAYMGSVAREDTKRDSAFRTTQHNTGESRTAGVRDSNAPKQPRTELVKDLSGDETEMPKRSRRNSTRGRQAAFDD